MRGRLWKTILKIKYNEAYAEGYANWARHCSQILNGICLLASASSITGWYLWKEHPLLWSLLLAVSQCYQVIKPLLMLEKRRTALKFYIPDVQKLSIKASEAWDRENTCDEGVLMDTVHKLEDDLYDLQAKYFELDDPLPDHFWLRKSAERKRDLFSKEFMNEWKENEHDAQSTKDTATI